MNKTNNANYFTYESYMDTKGRPYIETEDGVIYLTVTHSDDEYVQICTPSSTLINCDRTLTRCFVAYGEDVCIVYIEQPERIGGTLKVEPTETYSDKVKRVKKDAIDRIKECVEMQLDYVAKELGIDVDSISLNIESTQDVMRFDDGHTKTQTIRTITMDIKL